MLFRNILDILFASPVTAVATVVSISCASILVVNITANIDSSEPTNRSLTNKTATTTDRSSSDSIFENNTSRNSADYKTAPTRSSTAPETATDKYQTHTTDDRYSSTDYRQRKQSPDNAGARSNNNYSNSYRKYDQYDNEEYFVEEFSGSGNDSHDISNIRNNNSPILNYSGSANTTDNSTTNNLTTTPDSSTDTNSIENTSNTAPEKDFPSTLENTVRIDIDETQTISCQPVVTNGPPCMCTFTTDNADGSFTEVVDNCS